MAYTIVTEGLRKSFGKLPVLTGLDLRVPRSCVFALLGPNGAGKTTTIKILATLLRPDGGTVRVAGYDALTESHAVRASISLTGQYAAVDEVLTARENLLMMARLRRLDRAAARARTEELLARFDLVDVADRRVGTYSGGMKRRLDIALGLVSDPPVVFLDEPTTGLDPRSRRDVWESIAGLTASGVTVLLTTQYLEEADRLADRIAVIDGGRVIAEGTADELKARVGGEAAQLFLASDDALAAAARALDDQGGAPGRIDPETCSLHVPTDGSATAVRDVLDLMAVRGVAVERLALHRPTLDEVFLTLTERPVHAGTDRELEASAR